MTERRWVLLCLATVAAVAVTVPAGAGGSFAKKFDKQVKKKLTKPGTINQGKNPIDWTRLKGVPGGFADGNDAGTDIDSCPAGESIRAIDSQGNVTCEPDDVGEPGAGDVSAVLAGTGLTGGGQGGDVTLSADTSVLQARVTGTCPTDSSISAIAANGTVTCDTDGDSTVYAVSSSNSTSKTGTTTFGDLPGAEVIIHVPEDKSSLVTARFTAESSCYGAVGWCSVQILVAGGMLPSGNAGNFAFDSSDNNTETASSWESHTMERYAVLTPGQGGYQVKVQTKLSDAALNFGLAYWTLIVEVHAMGA